MEFVLNRPVAMTESLTCEFKEVKSHALAAVSKVVDEYVVAFLNESGGSIYWGIRDDSVVTGFTASNKIKDELLQVIGQKVAVVAPSIPGNMIKAPFHEVLDETGTPIPEHVVLEVRVQRPDPGRLYLTGSGEAYKRTIGGTKKFTGAELFLALGASVGAKKASEPTSGKSEQFPSVYRRAALVDSLIRGRRVLWVDDNPQYTVYERVALAELGVHVDVATSSEEALQFLRRCPPDVIVSDVARRGNQCAGLEFLAQIRDANITIPLAFYVGSVDPDRPLPRGAFGLTDAPDEILHMVFDALERGK